MKTTNLFKAVAFVAMTIVSVMNTEVKAQENNFITNEEVKNELVVAKTIFKQDGAQLYRHIRYEYSYDDQKRLTCKDASKWDGTKDEWTPYFKMTYQYGNDEIFAGLPKRFDVGRYHSWAVDKTGFPDSLEVTALSDDGCIMGLKHKHYDIHGIQFHPESVLTPEGKKIVGNWLDM